MTTAADKLELVKKSIKSYPDFPKPGILFRDVFGVMGNPEADAALRDLLLAHCNQYASKVTAVCALESRGFLFGPLMALHLRVPFVPIRKKGKLPGLVSDVSYEMEYGKATVEMQTDALKRGSNVLLVDDLLATGATLEAGCQLVKRLGSEVDHCLVVIELEELAGRTKLPCPVHSLIKL